MAANYESKETQNFARICRFVIDVTPVILKDLLITRQTKQGLCTALKNPKCQIVSLLNKQQKKILYPKGGVLKGSIKNLDTSVLYILLRTLGNIPPHQNGWGNAPDITDRSLSANIDCLYILRKETFSRASNTTLSEEDFQARWNIICQSVRDIQNGTLGKRWFKVAVDDVLTTKMDNKMAKYYIEELLVNVKDFKNEKMLMEDPEKFISEWITESHMKSKRLSRPKQMKSQMFYAKMEDSIQGVRPGSNNNSKQVRQPKQSSSTSKFSRSCWGNNSEPSSRLIRLKSKMDKTQIKDPVPEICPGSCNNSVSSNQLKWSKSSRHKQSKLRMNEAATISPQYHSNSKQTSHCHGTKSDMTATEKQYSSSHLKRSFSKITLGATRKEDITPEGCTTRHKKTSKSQGSATKIGPGWQSDSKHRNNCSSEMSSTEIEDSIPNNCPTIQQNMSRSEEDDTTEIENSIPEVCTATEEDTAEIEDFIPEACSGSYRNSNQASGCKSGMFFHRILVMMIILEFLKVIYKDDDKEEKVQEKVCCDLNPNEKSSANKFDMRNSSKLYYLMNDTITNMLLKKELKNLSSQLQFFPETLLDIYPVYGPGVGPAIDLLLSTTPPPSRQELLANEFLRLCTFHNYPAFRIVSCVLLAKAGFFYDGRNDEVICYSCNKSIAGWNLGSDPYKVHKESSPDCNHIRAMDNYMSVAASASKNSTTAEARPENSSTEAAAKSEPSKNTTSINSTADTGYNTQTTGSDFVGTAGFKFGGQTTENNNTSVPAKENNTSGPAKENNTSGPAGENNTSGPAGENNTSGPDGENNTSGPDGENNTSTPNPVSDSSLSARNSKGVLSTINSSSLLSFSGTNSTAVQDTSAPVDNYPSQPSESTGQTPVATPVAGYKGPANPQRTKAFYPDYVLPADRLKTFDKWPATIRQTAQQMLDSGFFYAGYDDCVRCFQCGIGLRNWEPPDNPHVEHARWSPRCAFLLQVKGPDFINLVMDAVAQLEQRKNNNQAAGQAAETTTKSSNNNTVVSTSDNQQNSSRSSVDNAAPSITPSGTPAGTSKPPSNTQAAVPKAKPSASQDAPAAGKDIKGTNTSIPTLSKPPSATASKCSSSSSHSAATAGKNDTSMTHSIMVDHASITNVATGWDKIKDLATLMNTEIVRKVKQDRYGEEDVKAALRILLDTKEANEITEAMIRDTVRKNTSVRNRRTALGGEAPMEPLSEELQRIKKENREMRERTVCKICLEDQVSIAFIPCGHLVACGHCAHAITRCAVCRKPITNKILTHMDV